MIDKEKLLEKYGHRNSSSDLDIQMAHLEIEIDKANELAMTHASIREVLYKLGHFLDAKRYSSNG